MGKNSVGGSKWNLVSRDRSPTYILKTFPRQVVFVIYNCMSLSPLCFTTLVHTDPRNESRLKPIIFVTIFFHLIPPTLSSFVFHITVYVACTFTT